VTAGNGADTIALGDWITEDQHAQILDFETAEDSLLFVWDDTSGEEEPEVSVGPDPDNSTLLQVRVGDVVIATVNGGSAINASDISLVPLTTAAATGLIPA